MIESKIAVYSSTHGLYLGIIRTLRLIRFEARRYDFEVQVSKLCLRSCLRAQTRNIGHLEMDATRAVSDA